MSDRPADQAFLEALGVNPDEMYDCLMTGIRIETREKRWSWNKLRRRLRRVRYGL